MGLRGRTQHEGGQAMCPEDAWIESPVRVRGTQEEDIHRTDMFRFLKACMQVPIASACILDVPVLAVGRYAARKDDHQRVHHHCQQGEPEEVGEVAAHGPVRIGSR